MLQFERNKSAEPVKSGLSFRDLASPLPEEKYFCLAAPKVDLREPGLLKEQNVALCVLDHSSSGSFAVSASAQLAGASVEELLRKPVPIITPVDYSSPSVENSFIRSEGYLFRKDEQALFLEANGLGDTQPAFVHPTRLGAFSLECSRYSNIPLISPEVERVL